MTEDTWDFIHAPDNEKPADELFAFLSVDATGEGICAHVIPGIGAALLVTAKRSNAEAMQALAFEISKAAGKPVRLVRFTRAETLWETKP